MEQPVKNDKNVGVAARIADGSAIDWKTPDVADDPALLEQLRAIAQVAALHRAPPWSLDAPPETWGSLTILSSVGAGKFGDVYLSWDARLHRRVALKLLHNTSSSLASPDRAIEEARLLARVRHPNVLTVYGAECINGQVGIWTEFVEGRTLEGLVNERGALDPAEVSEIGINLCRALAAVHEAGLLHRDIKAQNVMRETGGRIVLMDFGAGHDLALTPVRDGDLTGTPLYLAPELFAGGQHNHATDIYAVAVLLHYLLVGDYPIPGSTLDEVRAGHVGRTRSSLPERHPELSPSLVAAIERGLRPDPANRFKTASDFERALAEPLTTAASKPVNSSGRRAKAPMILAALTLVAVVALGAWQLLGHEPQAQSSISQTAVRQDDQPLPLTVIPAPDVPERPPIPAPPATGLGGDRLLLANGSIGTASRDGRFLALPGNDATLWIRDLTSSGPPRRVNTGSETGRALETPEFSHDGRWLAYAWTPPESRIARLVVADASLSNAPPRVVFDTPDDTVWLVHDWKPDGSAILVTLHAANGARHRLAWISTTDGSVVTLKEIPGTTALRPIVRVSPDGRFVAYAAREPVLQETGNPSNQYIYLISSDGSQTEAIVRTAASSENPVWSPDGSLILYTSDAAVSTDLWCVPVRDGHAVGQERLLRINVGAGFPLGFSKDGAYYFRKENPGLNLVFVADSARESDPTPEKTHVTREFVNGTRPLWSADGQSIAYIRKRPGEDDLVVYKTRDQVEQVLHKGLVLQDLVRVDARSVLAQRDVEANRLRPLEVAIATRLRTDRSPGEPDLLRTPAAAVSLDGTTLFTAARSVPNILVGQQTRPGGPWDRLVSVDLQTGAVKTLFRLPDNLATARTIPEVGLALSPDGLELAVAVQVQPFRLARLFRVGIDGTGFRELYHPYRTAGPYGKVAWTKQGIHFGEVFGEGSNVLWRVQRLDPDRGSISTVVAINGTDSDSQFDPSPDGRQIAFHPHKTFTQPFSPRAGARNEIWRLDLSTLVRSSEPKKQ